MGHSQGEGTFEEPDGPRDVLLGSQEKAHPARVWKNMVRVSFAGGDESVADRFWEGDIQQAIAVDVPEFAPAESELQAAVTVWFDFHARPLFGCFDDALLCPWNGHILRGLQA